MQQKQLPRVTSPSMPPPQSFASKLGHTIADISASGKMTSLGLEHLLMTTVGYEQQFTVNRVGFLESRSLLNLNGSLVSKTENADRRSWGGIRRLSSKLGQSVARPLFSKGWVDPPAVLQSSGGWGQPAVLHGSGREQASHNLPTLERCGDHPRSSQAWVVWGLRQSLEDALRLIIWRCRQGWMDAM